MDGIKIINLHEKTTRYRGSGFIPRQAKNYDIYFLKLILYMFNKIGI